MRYNIIKEGGEANEEKAKEKIKNFIELAIKALLAVTSVIAAIAELIEALD